MKEGFHIKDSRYTLMSDVIAQSGRELFNVPIDKPTIELWRDILMAVRAADIVIDITQDDSDRSRLIDGALNYLAAIEELEFTTGFMEIDIEIRNLRERLFTLDPHIRERFLDKLAQLCHVTEQLRKVPTSHEYAQLTRLEGQLTSRLFSLTASEQAKSAPGFQAFTKWFARLGRLGNVVDSVADMPPDYDSGLTMIQPTLSNRLSLLSSSAQDVLFVMRNVNPSSVVSLARSVRFVTTNPSKDIYYRTVASATNEVRE